VAAFLLAHSAWTTRVVGQTPPDSGAVLAEQATAEGRRQTREGSERAIVLWSAALRFYRAAGDRVGHVTALNNIGAIHNALGRLDSALAYFAQVVPLERALEDRAGEARGLNNIGAVHLRLGRPDSALTYFFQALPIRRAMGDEAGEAATLNNIATVHSRRGRGDSALSYLVPALAILRRLGDPARLAATLQNIGTVHGALGRPDSALTYYAQAIPMLQAAGDRATEAAALNNVGLVHADLGRPDSALTYYTQALPIRRVVGDRAGEAATLNNIGVVYGELGRSDSAMFYFLQALPIRRTVRDRAGEGTTLHNLAAVHANRARPDSALTYYAQALPIRRAVGDRAGEAVTLVGIGSSHEDLGRLDSAFTYYARALTIYRTVGDRAREAKALNNIGLVHSKLGRRDSALHYYTQALPIRRVVGDRAGEAVSLANLGALMHRQSPADLRAAVAYFDSAAAVQAAIGGHAGTDDNRMSLAEGDVGLFRSWALAWLALRDDGPEASALASLAAAERGRAQGLLSLLQRQRSRQANGGLLPGGRPEAGADLAGEARRLLASLPERAAALVYLVTADTMLAWLAAPGQPVQVFQAAIDELDLAAAVAELRGGLGADSAQGRARFALRAPALEPLGHPRETATVRAGGVAGRAATRLADRVLPPNLLRALRAALPAGGELIVIPHASLNLVPFAALPIDSTGAPLGVRYALRYTPSLATLAEVGRTDGLPRDSLRTAALVVGNPAMPVARGTGADVPLDPLPGAAEEGRWVATELGTAVLTGGEATEAEVKNRMSSASLIHLATHGYAYSSEARARRSFIALAATAEDDGLLTVGEVLDDPRKMRAELVVLSACQTGLGNLRRAEGTVGLQRAFLAKGARSLLVSLWSVSDQATTLLMQRFYSHWLRDPDRPSKAEALRRAQLDVRATPGFESPRYWAAFQLVGAQ
jgi:tetratricopeptide (TPR) repeat protein